MPTQMWTSRAASYPPKSQHSHWPQPVSMYMRPKPVADWRRKVTIKKM